jgi:hypothetical protein
MDWSGALKMNSVTLLARLPSPRPGFGLKATPDARDHSSAMFRFDQEVRMSRVFRNFAVVTLLAITTAACGDNPTDRALAGRPVGAAGGAVVGSTVGSPVGTPRDHYGDYGYY